MKLIYDIVGEKFFTPLSSKNKTLYLNSILFLHDLISELDDYNQNDKEVIISKLEFHLNEYGDLYYDDDGEEKRLDSHAKALMIINSLKEYGWLYEEPISNRISLGFYDYSLSFIDLIKDLTENNKALYTGYYNQIQSIIENFDYKKIESLEMLELNLKQLLLLFNRLYSNVQRFYRNITRDKSKLELKELLETFTHDYKESFFDSAYVKLKVDEHIERNISYLIEKAEDVLINDYYGIDMLVDAYAKSNDISTSDAKKYINSKCDKICNNIKKIPILMERIDNKNNRYVTRSISVIYHLLNRGYDIEGTINKLIDYVKDDLVEEKIAKISDLNYYSFNRLSKPKSRQIKINPEILEVGLNVSDEELKKALVQFDNETKYTINAINDFVDEFLGDKKERHIIELDVKTKHEFVMIIAILMHSKSPSANYHVILTDMKETKNEILITDFILVRKD